MALRGEVAGAAYDHSRADLEVFNHWLAVSRLRSAAAIAFFVLALELLGIGKLRVAPVLALCIALSAFSVAVLRLAVLAQRPQLLFVVQCAIDLLGITLGIGVAASGMPALFFRLLFALVIVPPSLFSVGSGLLISIGASLGHEVLLVLDRGASVATLTSVESAVPVFLFFLVAQQCFFYARHLKEKNLELSELASNLNRSRRKLAGLVRVARTLNATLEAPELLARMNRSALVELEADWAATFLVHRGAFRLAATSDSSIDAGNLAGAELPLSDLSCLKRLGEDRVLLWKGPEVANAPVLLTRGRPLAALLLAGLYRDDELAGFLALGYDPGHDGRARIALDQLGAIAEYATVALRNAQLLEDARQASSLKSEFLSTISHELRTPMNVMIGYTEMLRDGAAGALTHEQREIFDRIDSEARGLFELIDATLQVGRLETGRDAITLTRTAVGQLVEALRSVADRLPQPAQIGVAWDVRVPPSAEMVTDIRKVALILRNLVSNAFKFTAEGMVRILLHGEERHLVLVVHDTGMGIAEENLPLIFEMFRQVESGDSQRSGGVGLGLYIVKQMVQRLHGRVEVESQLGRGSTFRVTLPGYDPLPGRISDPIRTEREIHRTGA